MIYMLIHEEGTWGKLERHAKYKYKQLIKEISPVDLTELMKLTLKANENNCKSRLIFGSVNLDFGSEKQ